MSLGNPLMPEGYHLLAEPGGVDQVRNYYVLVHRVHLIGGHPHDHVGNPVQSEDVAVGAAAGGTGSLAANAQRVHHLPRIAPPRQPVDARE